MARSARISRARHSTPAFRSWVIFGLVGAVLGGALLLFSPQKPGQVEKGGRFIVGQAPVSPESREQPQKEELTFYKALTDQGDKAPSVIQHQSPKAVQSPTQVDMGRPTETNSVQMNRSPAKRYTLQVGSFVEKNSAQKLVARLMGKGYPAYLVEARLAAQDVRYRVRVGSFGDRAQAKVLAERLEKDEGLKSFVTFAEQGTQ